MEITRSINPSFQGDYIYYLSEGEKTLKFLFGGNLDLYIYLYDKSLKEIREGDKSDFLITKEQYAIYSLFEELYEKINTGNVFSDDSNIFEYTNNFNNERNLRTAIEKGLINYNDEIEWYCDNYPMGEGDSLKIIKEEDQFRLIFERHNDKYGEDFGDLSIRICNSGSRYLPFNICFMNLYNKLQKIDPDNYQMHIEEYLYKQKIKK